LDAFGTVAAACNFWQRDKLFLVCCSVSICSCMVYETAAAGNYCSGGAEGRKTGNGRIIVSEVRCFCSAAALLLTLVSEFRSKATCLPGDCGCDPQCCRQCATVKHAAHSSNPLPSLHVRSVQVFQNEVCLPFNSHKVLHTNPNMLQMLSMLLVRLPLPVEQQGWRGGLWPERDQGCGHQVSHTNPAVC
jgi:hypothetical protein